MSDRTDTERLDWLDTFLGEGGEAQLADDGIEVELWLMRTRTLAPTLREAIDKAIDGEVD